MQLNFIRPESLNNELVSSWFSLKNPTLHDGAIPGLNLGYHTDEDEEVISRHRKLLLQELGGSVEQLAYAHQIHSNKVKTVDSGGFYEGYDGLVTDTPGTILAIQVADCAAILLADLKNRVIGACHAGWRGVVAGVLLNTLDSMAELGADRSEIISYISPCISQARFEVGNEVASQFPDNVVDYTSFEKPHVDLKQFLVDQMLEVGMKSKYISTDSGCTMTDSHQFYSYRREKKQSGRMMALIRLNPVHES